MRQPIVAGNWKMHKTQNDAARLAGDIVSGLGEGGPVEVVLCPTFTSLHAVARKVDGTPVRLGAQDVHWEREGACTGEISAGMLREAGCRYVIVGHSERRTHFGETDAGVNRKTLALLEAELHPIICIGETLEERESGATETVLGRQLEAGLNGVGARVRRAVIAYEPVWAIGTGRTASPEQVQSAHAFIRRVVAANVDDEVAAAVRIQYGGSVKPSNAGELFALPDVDGGLIGGASLEAGSFLRIVAAADGASDGVRRP
jgi:triosephosphate isomerase